MYGNTRHNVSIDFVYLQYVQLLHNELQLFDRINSYLHHHR